MLVDFQLTQHVSPLLFSMMMCLIKCCCGEINWSMLFTLTIQLFAKGVFSWETYLDNVWVEKVYLNSI